MHVRVKYSPSLVSFSCITLESEQTPLIRACQMLQGERGGRETERKDAIVTLPL